MSTYATTNKDGLHDRSFVIDSEQVFRRTDEGELVEVTATGNRVNTNIVTATEFLPDYYVVKDNAGLVVENASVTYPETPSHSVVPTLLLNTLVGVPGETTGGNLAPGHVIGLFSETMIEAPCGDAFGVELRVDPRRFHLDQYVAVKHVIGPDAQNGGTVGAYVLEQLDDMRIPVQNVAKFQRNYMDPRLVTTHTGGELRPSEQITANKVLTDQDSGKRFIVVSATGVAINIPDALTSAGFHADFLQGGAGAITITHGAASALYSKANQITTNGQLASVEITGYPFQAFLARFTSAT